MILYMYCCMYEIGAVLFYGMGAVLLREMGAA